MHTHHAFRPCPLWHLMRIFWGMDQESWRFHAYWEYSTVPLVQYANMQGNNSAVVLHFAIGTKDDVDVWSHLVEITALVSTSVLSALLTRFPFLSTLFLRNVKARRLQCPQSSFRGFLSLRRWRRHHFFQHYWFKVMRPSFNNAHSKRWDHISCRVIGRFSFVPSLLTLTKFRKYSLKSIP
jgi:hypothetical protein